MLTLLKRLVEVSGAVSYGSSGPGAIPRPRMTTPDYALTRKQLNELLSQTPSLPAEAMETTSLN